MTGHDISGYVATLDGALAEDDEKVGMKAIIRLVEIALLDLHRIADALEYSQTKGPQA